MTLQQRFFEAIVGEGKKQEIRLIIVQTFVGLSFSVRNLQKKNKIYESWSRKVFMSASTMTLN